MSTVGKMERLFKRVGKVLTISADASIVEAARKMTENEVGSLIVMDGPDLVGICSERDITRELATGVANSAETPVRNAMTANVISCTPDTPISKARRMMAAHGIRHLPVVVGGVPVGMVSSRDILAYRLYETSTMLAEAKKDAQAAAEAKNEFLSNVSYEVRTPMSGIIGMTDLALDTALTDEQRDYLGVVKQSAQSLLSVITNILDFTELSGGKIALHEAAFHLHAALNRCATPHQDYALAKGLRFTLDVQPDVPEELLGDADRLGQVLTNLLGNAIKFTDSGEVALSVRRLTPAADANGQHEQDGRVGLLFTVRDTGGGIPADKQKSIFEPFSSADEPYKRKHDGAGLGLASSARLVQLMGGRIWLEDTPGGGSTFHFTASFGRQRKPEPVLEPVG